MGKIHYSGQFIIKGNVKFQNITFTQDTAAELNSIITTNFSAYSSYKQLTIEGCEFTQCKAPQGGALTIIQDTENQLAITNTKFTSCQSTTEQGGAIYATITQGSIQITNSQFNQCNSKTSGGAIYSEINNGELNIQSSSFDTCTCTQPGNGAAIAVSQQSQTSKIFISGTTFKDCKTLANSSNPTYGWGSGIYIITNLAATNFNDSNFQLSNLIFTGCEAVNKAGHHIHIQSPSTIDTGSAIKNGNLLTVSDASDIYTSANYAYEYMGIDTSNAGTGTIDQQFHIDLFRQHYISKVPNPCYIDASNGVNVEYCGGQRYKCNTIAYAIGRNTLPPSGITPSKDINFKLILTTIPSNDNSLQIGLPMDYHNYITIQSNGYIPGGNEYAKYKITSSSNSNPLFSVTVYGHLELLGIILDNLNPNSQRFLFDIYNNQDNNNIPNVTINDCEFNLLYIGGSSSFTQCQSTAGVGGALYAVINGGEAELNEVTFSKCSGLNGGAIYSTISGDGKLTIKDSCSFTSCTSTENGGAIYASLNGITGNGGISFTGTASTFTSCVATQNGGGLYSIINSGEIEMNEVTLDECSGLNGGAIYSTISGDGKLTIKDSCSFTSCTSTSGNGGGIYSILKYSISTGGIFIINITDSTQSTFSLCSASQLGGGIYLDLESGSETKFDLSGASYLTGNNAQYGKSLFIKAANLRSAIPIGDASRIKIGAGNNENNQLNNLMGYDLGIDTLAIPLYFVYTAIAQDDTTTSISRGLVQVSLGSVSIIDIKMESFTKSGGRTTTLNQFSANGITLSGGSLISYSSSGNLNIDGCTFTSITKTIANGNGGVISGILSSISGSILITGTESTFTSCTVPNDSGLGGAIYLDIQSDGETKYDLTGASYLTGNNALYGKNLFINAINLRTAVPVGDPTRIKIGAGNNEQTQLNNLMGYDNENTQFAIPLYYIYTAIAQDVYHVNNPTQPFQNGSGHNNVGCGHYYWPCLTIEYALSRNPSSTQRIIGVINGYEFNEQLTFSSTSFTILIQNLLNPTNNQTITILSDLKIANTGRFVVDGQIVEFKYLNFLIQSGGSSIDYIIQSTLGTSSISISNCEIHKDTTTSISRGLVQDTTTSISRGLVQVSLGSVSIIDIKMESFTKSGGRTTTLNQFSANGITLSGGSLISYSSSGNLNIDGCTFTSITKTIANGNGGVISGILSSISGSILITGTESTFTSCTVPNDSGLGGAIYLDIQSDGETKYDLTGASYLTGNNALYGKNLFINAINLRSAVPIGDPTRIKLGAQNPETDFYNLMGYDNGNSQIAIPLYYLYTAVDQSIYNVKDTTSNGQGNDNIGCGHLDYPCLTIYYAIEQSGSASEKKVESGINQQLKYVIEGISGASQIELTKCLMIMASNTEGYQLSRGLIELNIGALTL
ncbi:MAG: hypothetical protein EZS28_011259, partial [Streblomastix strix]